MRQNVKIVLCFMSLMLCFMVVNGQNNTTKHQNISATKNTDITKEQVVGFEDPLIPQNFAVDTKTKTLVVIDTPENSIVILKRQANEYKVVDTINVDSTWKRHDLQFIYRPKSVAIYENSIVFLASNRDSSYLMVVDMSGNKVYKSQRFAGAASAFSYDKISKHLYIAGLNASGYNIFDIDASEGFANIKIDSVSTDKSAFKKYQIPKKSEVLAKYDPNGLMLTVIAMFTVFFALFVISIVLMGFAKSLRKVQQKRALRNVPKEEQAIAKEQVKEMHDVSGEVYAAISAAIYMYNEELHDEENTVLTINRVSRGYSPWSSKVYNMHIYRR